MLGLIYIIYFNIFRQFYSFRFLMYYLTDGVATFSGCFFFILQAICLCTCRKKENKLLDHPLIPTSARNHPQYICLPPLFSQLSLLQFTFFLISIWKILFFFLIFWILKFHHMQFGLYEQVERLLLYSNTHMKLESAKKKRIDCVGQLHGPRDPPPGGTSNQTLSRSSHKIPPIFFSFSYIFKRKEE